MTGRTRAALLALVFGLVGATIKTVARAFYYAPLLVLGGAGYLTVFDASQLQALAVGLPWERLDEHAKISIL